MDNKIFDLWADGYESSVADSDENNEFPFAGYKEILNEIYKRIMDAPSCNILDIGIGTGVLAAKLYDNGYTITGLDFSEKMLDLTREKMPKAKLLQCDFSQGMPDELAGERFDFIVSTYALHHLPDEGKAVFLLSLAKFLAPDGVIFIGDAGFETKADWDKCRAENQDEWDDDEYYMVFSEFAGRLESVFTTEYRQISHCGGFLELRLK
ncbi:MAG: class I SAM-dependent methyltransferase [Defluviitaleaceae bacterium]|nr:class I SAM-dependent methyltransferase [Defluviitaleaceae bacterium]